MYIECIEILVRVGGTALIIVALRHVLKINYVRMWYFKFTKKKSSRAVVNNSS